MIADIENGVLILYIEAEGELEDTVEWIGEFESGGGEVEVRVPPEHMTIDMTGGQVH